MSEDWMGDLPEANATNPFGKDDEPYKSETAVGRRFERHQREKQVRQSAQTESDDRGLKDGQGGFDAEAAAAEQNDLKDVWAKYDQREADLAEKGTANVLRGQQQGGARRTDVSIGLGDSQPIERRPRSASGPITKGPRGNKTFN